VVGRGRFAEHRLAPLLANRVHGRVDGADPREQWLDQVTDQTCRCALVRDLIADLNNVSSHRFRGLC
jgi:hypothetical protein